MKRLLSALLVLGIALAATGAHGSAAGQVRVFVSVPSQKHFVQQIVKDRVAVEVVVLPGAGPHAYEANFQQCISIADGLDTRFNAIFADKAASR